MWAVGLTLMLGVTPVTDKLANYRGQPVLSVEIDAPPDEDLEFLRSLIDIQPGYLLAASQLQSAIKRLYALGRFANVEVRAQRLSGVVLLDFHLRPLQRLDALEIEGLDWAEEEPLRAALALRPGAEVDRRTPQLLQQRASEHLAQVGFPNARVTVEPIDEDERGERSFSLRILEAVPRRVAAIRFVGEPRVHHQVLRRIIKTEVGDILNQKRLARDRERLARAYVAHGFLTARVAEPQVQSVGDIDTVLFNIAAGDRIAMALTGNHSATEEDLRGLWPEASPRIERGSLKAFAAAIRGSYQRRGFADVEVEVRGYRDKTRGITRYLYLIAEGEPVRVTTIDFVGAKAIPAAILGEQVRSVLRNELLVGADFQPMTTAELEVSATGLPQFGDRSASAPYLTRYPPEERWVPELYQKALEGIVAVYKDRGYLAANVEKPLLSRDGNELRIAVKVDEGPQTRIRAIRFVGNEALAAKDLLALLEQKTGLEEGTTVVTPGGPLSASGIETGRIALVRRYRDLGHLYARIFTKAVSTPDKQGGPHAAEVVFTIEEGPQVRIRSLLVRGNRYTNTDTIRSQISLEPGDIYRLDQAVRDQRAVSRLGVFSGVQVKLIDEERPEEQKDLVAEVVERKRQALDLFVGLSTADGIRAGASYSIINLFGYASFLNFDGRFNLQPIFDVYGPYADSMQARYDSYFVNAAGKPDPSEFFTKGIERALRVGVRSRRFNLGPMGTALRVDFTNEQDQAVTYSAHETALTGGIEIFPLSGLAVALEPKVSYTDAECPRDATDDEQEAGEEKGQCRVGADARTVIPEGERFAFEIGPTLTFDLRNDPIHPTSGLWLKGSGTYAIGEVAKPVAKDEPRDIDPFSYVKLEATVVGFVPLGGPNLVLTAQAGHIARITGRVPIDERFFLGGRETMRGFGQGRMIADDACVGGGPHLRYCPESITKDPPETTGGNTFLLLRTELRLALTESFAVDFFVDLGNLWIDLARVRVFRPRVGVGAGLRYETGVGALVLDFGFNPDPRTWETVAEPYFSVSRF